MRGVFGVAAHAVHRVPRSLLLKLLEFVKDDHLFCDLEETRYNRLGHPDFCALRICYDTKEGTQKITAFNREKCLAGGWRGHNLERLWPDLFW